MHPADFWEACEGARTGRVRCLLCPNRCVIPDGARGRCGVRANRGGKLFSLVYGRPCSVHVDPIEKKPLYHFLPGSLTYSIGTAGCVLRCRACQNWQISQTAPEDLPAIDLSPERAVSEALRTGCQSIAFTYNEPAVFFEYAFDTAVLARKKGLKNVFVTSGYINPAPLKKIAGALDAANVDLKGFTEAFYSEVCGGNLAAVQDAILDLKAAGVWIEITTLVIPGLNDGPDDIRRMCAWIAKKTGPGTPLHFSRFFPNYKLTDTPPTPLKTLEQARDIALDEGLKFVHLGNIGVRP